MGFSALLPSATALIQGVGRFECRLVANFSGNMTVVADFSGNPPLIIDIPPRFGVTVFNIVLTFFMGISLISFLFLNSRPIAKQALAKGLANGLAKDEAPEGVPPGQDSALLEGKGRQDCQEMEENSEIQEMEKNPETPKISKFFYIFFLISTAYICALMNGALL